MKRFIAYAISLFLLGLALCWAFPGCVFFTKSAEHPIILTDDCAVTMEPYKSDSAIVRWYIIRNGSIETDVDTMPFKGVEK